MNILFLMADEFRYDVAGFMGNGVVSTPHLDRLAGRCVVFDNAYTPSPVCIPARQCLATGKYPLHIGCEGFDDDIPAHSATFARWFSERGYYTVACGKLHHRGPDQMQGWVQRIGAETAVRWPKDFSARSQIGRRRWRGAEELKEAGAGISPLALHDDYTVQGACDFLRVHFGGMYAIPAETPLFLMVSLQQPHFPLLAEKALWEKYQHAVPVFWHEPAAGHTELDAGRLGATDGLDEADARRATAAYYAMVEATDRRFGLLFEAIEAAGQNLSDWIVVFTSDHGEMLGQHGSWGKRKFYEASARVPLFVGAPGLSPGRSKQPSNLVDLFPTLTRLAGLADAVDLDGHDLFARDRPEETFCQHEKNQFMIRAENLKYLRFGGAEDVLFDLASDPGETRNALADPELLAPAARLRARLENFIATTCVRSQPE